MDIEQELRARLAARDPGPQFTAAVLARIDAGAAVAARPRLSLRARRPLPLALAASLLVAITSFAVLHVQREQEREQAGQLQLALIIASERLNQVQQRLYRPIPTENGI